MTDTWTTEYFVIVWYDYHLDEKTRSVLMIVTKHW